MSGCGGGWCRYPPGGHRCRSSGVDRDERSARDFALDIRGQLVSSPDRLKANVLPVNFIELQPQIFSQHAHQGIDFVTRPLPVLSRKRIKSQRAETQPGARVNRSADRFDAGTMSGNSRLTAQRCPTAIAVHDDGDVLR